MEKIVIQPLTAHDASWVDQWMVEHWSDTMIAIHDEILYPARLPGFVALHDQARIGLITYRVVDDHCEIVTLDSTQPGQGIGTRLIDAVKAAARAAGCNRLWLITTNDNVDALRFYQKRGFELVAVHRRAVERARRLKPTIPFIGNDGIPIRDELELELRLDAETI